MQALHPLYLEYFDRFNRQLFFEAHESLEVLWLAERGQPNGLFYKGLIQLAGAFVHLQKNRLRPAAALFKLAEINLQQYPVNHVQLDVRRVLGMISAWLHQLEGTNVLHNPLLSGVAPTLNLNRP